MRAEPKISFIGTPIGNLGDLSQRAIDTIVKSDVVFAEDTRTATNLLNYLGIKKKIVSCHKDNEKKAAEKIILEVISGRHPAVISEAGMPCISDPGSEVINALIKEGIPFEIVPGPTALIHGLIASGFSGGPFFFYGFLPHKMSDKKKIIENIKNIPYPIIFYESPHRVKDTVEILLENFPTPIACCRELTKIYEETVFIENATELENLTVKGEFVLVVNNSSSEEKTTAQEFNINNIAKKLLQDGFSSQEVVRILKILGVKRNDAYKMIINQES